MTTKYMGRNLRAFVLPVAGTLATGDNQAGALFRGKWLIDGISVHVKALGDTSGATTINLQIAGTDIFASGDRPSIAYNASLKYTEKDQSVMADYTIEDGEFVQVDIDAIPGGTASTGLTVYIWAVPA